MAVHTAVSGNHLASIRAIFQACSAVVLSFRIELHRTDGVPFAFGITGAPETGSGQPDTDGTLSVSSKQSNTHQSFDVVSESKAKVKAQSSKLCNQRGGEAVLSAVLINDD